MLEAKTDCYGKTGLFVASFAFCVISFEPIMIQTCSAPLNDCQNFSFVNDIYVDGKKLARNGRKTATSYAASFLSHYRRVLFLHLLVFNLLFLTFLLDKKVENDVFRQAHFCRDHIDNSRRRSGTQTKDPKQSLLLQITQNLPI